MKIIMESKGASIAAISVYILALFAAGHIGLVNIYRAGREATIVTFVLFLATAIVIMALHKGESIFSALLVGFLLWGALGEAGEHLGISDIVNFKNIFLLAGIVLFFGFLMKNGKLSNFMVNSIGFFIIIWLFHFIMVNQFELLGKTHFTTYIACVLFVLLVFASFLFAFKAKQRSPFWTAVFISSLWAVLEYFWGWKLLPKPW